METTWRLYTLDTPTRWKAGAIGEEKTPFYFDCGDCGAHEPEIHALIAPVGSTVAGLDTIAILRDDATHRFPRLALFCAACTEKRTEGKTGREITPAEAV